MSQAIADSVVKDLREKAELIYSMCSVYPGDSTGDLSADAYIMSEIADLIDEVDWDIMRSHFMKQRPQIEVTYYEDSVSERSPHGICSDRDHE